MNAKRAIMLILSSIEKLELDLSEKTVLTEVGSGYYGLLPIIATCANAKQVFAWTRDSNYGNGSENIEYCKNLLKATGNIDKVEFFIGEINIEHLKQADIITNSGFLRPLNENKLKYTKKEVVIPLMYEKWELRNEDIDIKYCKSKGIKVAGTWENHPDLKVFSNIGPLAVKMAMQAGYEVFDNNIVVWSDDDFGLEIEKSFMQLGAKRVFKTIDFEELRNEIAKVDFIFIADYSELRNYNNEIFSLEILKQLNPSLGFVHLYGDVDCENFIKFGFNVFPEKNGKAQQMTFTLGHVGLKPIINLQVAGLKVADYSLKRQSNNLIQKLI